jgi:hypothetical protein
MINNGIIWDYLLVSSNLENLPTGGFQLGKLMEWGIFHGKVRLSIP